MLPRVDPMRHRNLAMRGYAAFLGTPAGKWIAVNVAWKLDPHLMRLTGGTVGAAWPIRTVLLETTGAKSGATRSNAVIYFHDGELVTVIASKLGADHHPAWYHNLRANPDARLAGEPVHAEIVTDPVERHRLWTLADRVYSPYAGYRTAAARSGREIPIVQFTPRA